MMRENKYKLLNIKEFFDKRFFPVLLVILFSFTILCRCCRVVADFYAINLYPIISGFLSFLSSFLPLSFQTIAIACIICYGVWIIVIGIKKRDGWKNTAKRELMLLLWTYVWFYMSWCLNYSRSTIYERTETNRVGYDEKQFLAFAEDFVQSANKAWTTDTLVNYEALEKEIKSFYTSQDAKYGLSTPHTWQHPKVMDIPRFYSSVGVTGFMAPLFSESFLNPDLQACDYPYVYAHELSHLLGISNEAEASWWAFYACTSSTHKGIRYSAYKAILPYLLFNARGVLAEEKYHHLFSCIRPEIIDDMQRTKERWKSLRSPVLDEIQGRIYDAFLKTNQIQSGTKNYSEVIAMLIYVKH